MEKTHSFLTCISYIALCIVLCACSDPDPSSSNNSSNIEKTLKNYCWKSDSYFDYGLYDSDTEFYWDREVATFYFLSDNICYVKVNRHKEDTYLGSKNEEKTIKRIWYIDDEGIIRIDGVNWALQGDYLIQQNTTEPSTLHKTALTSSDRDYMELAPFYSLTGSERANFNVDFEVKPHGNGSVMHYDVPFYPIDVKISLQKKDHIYSRHIGSIEVSFDYYFYKMNNLHNYWTYEAKPVKSISINKDEDLIVEYPELFAVTGDASIKMKIRAHDYETGKYYTIYDTTINVKEPDYIKQM